MAYEYKQHQADVGIRITADTIEHAFIDGAKAMFGVMVEIEGVENKQKVHIDCTGTDIPSLFVNFLNELLSQKDIEDMFFSDFRIDKLEEKEGMFYLEATASGERIAIGRHEIRTEVKAATFHGIRYENTDEGIMLQCVLDV
ncbi:hypothetical protein COV93_03495 [Candidatus Woesearchaeota archaeon CG11_big_fil_rev_8_21_14_0_20_43_8]|nr:MAG: hypothetical protein COV93_03495 [Candidatus Woesearchaeota archaeon CG11_big_fil_rev_8_21_14_0_20_43_8]PIO05230.1 MAG: hypothetical protein COT47_05635 [Candidatus Woesearchaeota archaeon CG08_land_8_20_14_0_20_43_7]